MASDEPVTMSQIGTRSSFEQMAKDAARYRKFRDGHIDSAMLMELRIECSTPEEFDLAVDSIYDGRGN